MQRENEAGGSRQRRSREEVRRLVDEFEASGSERAEFCRSRGLALSTLQRHLRARRLGSESRSPGCHLVAVSLATRTEARPKAEIIPANQAEVIKLMAETFMCWNRCLILMRMSIRNATTMTYSSFTSRADTSG